MSDGALVTREMIRNRARAAFMGGKSRDSHGMNPWTAAAQTWLHAYDTLASSTLSLQCTAGAARRVDAAQEVAA